MHAFEAAWLCFPSLLRTYAMHGVDFVLKSNFLRGVFNRGLSFDSDRLLAEGDGALTPPLLAPLNHWQMCGAPGGLARMLHGIPPESRGPRLGPQYSTDESIGGSIATRMPYERYVTPFPKSLPRLSCLRQTRAVKAWLCTHHAAARYGDRALLRGCRLTRAQAVTVGIALQRSSCYGRSGCRYWRGAGISCDYLNPEMRRSSCLYAPLCDTNRLTCMHQVSSLLQWRSARSARWTLWGDTTLNHVPE
ncbi:hypothetical protein BC628DRAFT_957970 [Trametes gibbosa]|nr:hypothetical protein BC628DRAFT_957970 [Trametes gibbosa]